VGELKRFCLWGGDSRSGHSESVKKEVDEKRTSFIKFREPEGRGEIAEWPCREVGSPEGKDEKEKPMSYCMRRRGEDGKKNFSTYMGTNYTPEKEERDY